ncbi:FHA domain-containing protein, partial [Mycobacterium kansasii]|uniref:FHA domain-containing protein n=1 Tax=Mycobacterium kansasii TaxID=1768 RepID=UPI0011456491
MNTVAPPVLTVLGLGPQRTFAAGHDIIVGSDLRADMHVSHPSVSRAHLLLRFDHGRWMAIDNGSHEGTFVDHRRVHAVEIHPGQRINIGSPDGPCLTFEVGQPEVPAGRPPRTAPIPAAQLRPHPAARPVPPPAPGPIPAMEPAHPAPPTRLGRVHPGPQPPPTRMGPYLAPDPAPPRPPSHPPVPPRDPSNLATKVIRSLWPESGRNRRLAGAVTVGRAQDNAIVVPDVLASRRHAFLVQTALGTEIRDARSVNGTYVNGVRIGSAVLSEGDVVTIGNVDMVFSAGTLTRQADAGTPAGGLEVNRVQFEIDGKQLLDNISLTARPGTLTAIIGGSGAGKTTLARLIAGYTRPSAGSITFEGHDIHAEYATLRSRIGMVPQDDVVHRQLTVNQALGYAAELRLPPDTSSADRAKVVARVLEELELTEHGDTRVDKLSGGQRKRASVALELLTGPSLLILD